MRVVLQTPVVSGSEDALRYVMWCSHAVKKREKAHALTPIWFVSDRLSNPWLWDPNVFQYFCTDLGFSYEMEQAADMCRTHGIPFNALRLESYDQKSWKGFKRGKWPPLSAHYVSDKI